MPLGAEWAVSQAPNTVVSSNRMGLLTVSRLVVHQATFNHRPRLRLGWRRDFSCGWQLAQQLGTNRARLAGTDHLKLQGVTKT